MMLRKVLSRRRKSDVSPKTSKSSKALEISSAPICQLPLEIFLAITSQLSYVSRWCLASTCRTLYRLIAKCYPDCVKTRKYYFTTRRLVKYWELCARDLPDYLVCYLHTDLYLWRPQHQVGHQCPQSVKIGRYDAATPHLCYPPLTGYRRWHKGLYMTECLRDLILRYHLRGPQWGLPVSVLSHNCKGPISPAVYERKDVEGKIIHDRLMVKTVTSHTTRIRRFKYLPVRAEVYEAAVCPHTSLEIWVIFKAAVEYLITAQGLAEADFDVRGFLKPTAKNVQFERRWYHCSTLLKCLWCATDVRVSIRRVALKEMEITFATYHDLGGFVRNKFHNAMFMKAYPYHRRYYDFGPPEEHGERLSCSLEDLYESSQQKSCRNLDATRPGDSPQPDATEITASTPTAPTLSSGFMCNRCICDGLMPMCSHIEHRTRTQMYAEYFIRTYDVLQFELQS